MAGGTLLGCQLQLELLERQVERRSQSGYESERVER